MYLSAQTYYSVLICTNILQCTYLHNHTTVYLSAQTYYSVLICTNILQCTYLHKHTTVYLSAQTYYSVLICTNILQCTYLHKHTTVYLSAQTTAYLSAQPYYNIDLLICTNILHSVYNSVQHKILQLCTIFMVVHNFNGGSQSDCCLHQQVGSLIPAANQMDLFYSGRPSLA